MKKNIKFETLENAILRLQKRAKSKFIVVKDIAELLSGKGRSLAVLLLSLPFCQPIQIPGLSIAFGIAIAFIGFSTAIGKRAWLPKKILSKRLKGRTVEKIGNKALFLIRKIKSWIHPRFVWICHIPCIRVVNGFIIFFLGLFLALPLPLPLSNMLSAWSAFFISFGTLEDNGTFLLLGYLFTVLTLLFFAAAVLSIKHAF